MVYENCLRGAGRENGRRDLPLFFVFFFRLGAGKTVVLLCVRRQCGQGLSHPSLLHGVRIGAAPDPRPARRTLPPRTVLSAQSAALSVLRGAGGAHRLGGGTCHRAPVRACLRRPPLVVPRLPAQPLRVRLSARERRVGVPHPRGAAGGLVPARAPSRSRKRRVAARRKRRARMRARVRFLFHGVRLNAHLPSRKTAFIFTRSSRSGGRARGSSPRSRKSAFPPSAMRPRPQSPYCAAALPVRAVSASRTVIASLRKLFPPAVRRRTAHAAASRGSGAQTGVS